MQINVYCQESPTSPLLQERKNLGHGLWSTLCSSVTQRPTPQRGWDALLSRLLVLHLSSTRKEKESLEIRHISFSWRLFSLSYVWFSSAYFLWWLNDYFIQANEVSLSCQEFCLNSNTRKTTKRISDLCMSSVLFPWAAAAAPMSDEHMFLSLLLVQCR